MEAWVRTRGNILATRVDGDLDNFEGLGLFLDTCVSSPECLHPPLPPIKFPTATRTRATHIRSLVLLPCLAMARLRMILTMMETPPPSALALCVDHGLQPPSLPDTLPGFL